MKTILSFVRRSFTFIAANLLILVLLIGTIELGSFSFLKLRPLLSSLRNLNAPEALTIENDGRVNSPIYPDKAIARKIFQEIAKTRVRYEPYNVWALEKTNGTSTNVDSLGRRRTCQNTVENREDSVIQIFMFGGSTLFGEGAEDCDTIPSQLAREISTRFPRSKFEITNFGTTAYQSTQELIQLLRLLQAGARPQIVIFYDGVNDIYASGHSPGIPGVHMNLESLSSRFDSSAFSSVVRASNTFQLFSYVTERSRLYKTERAVPDLGEKIQKALLAYKFNIEILDSLSRKYGFHYIAFWQPVLLDGSKPTTGFEENVVKKAGILNPLYQRSYLELRRTNFGKLSFVDISGIFQQVRDDIFIDFCHMGKKGNQSVAAAMLPSLLPYLTP